MAYTTAGGRVTTAGGRVPNAGGHVGPFVPDVGAHPTGGGAPHADDTCAWSANVLALVRHMQKGLACMLLSRILEAQDFLTITVRPDGKGNMSSVCM